MRKVIENGITVLTADSGMKLTNGASFGSVVCLGVNDSADNWKEITEAEAERLIAESESDEEATIADYEASLAEMGVEV